MSVIQIILSGQVLAAALVYALASMGGIILFEFIHQRLDNAVLQWQWDHIGMPLLRAGLMLLFIALAWPALFGLGGVPSLGELLARDDLRFSYLLDLVFIITLLFPLIPVIGAWEELILPLQGVTAAAMTFNWLAGAAGKTGVHYWPGLGTLALMVAVALVSHWLALTVSHGLGERLDKKFNVQHSGLLLSRALVLVMQYPVIVIYSHALGQQF